MIIKELKIIAIIPARGGSKGLPKKNIRLLAGKPLVARTIESALKSKYINRVIVSTEDKEIAEISQKYKAEVIQRPKKLAADNSDTEDAVFQVLGVLKKDNYIPDVVILLQPTSPLREAKDIDDSLEIFLKNNHQSVVSVSNVEKPPYWCFKVTKEKFLKPAFGWKYFKLRRQDLPKLYAPNGAIYVSSLKNLFKYKSFYSKNILPYIMPSGRSIDIDKEDDLKMAEYYFKNKK